MIQPHTHASCDTPEQEQTERYHLATRSAVVIVIARCCVAVDALLRLMRLVRLVGLEMMVATGEVAGVEEANVRSTRGRPSGTIRPIWLAL